MSPWQEEADPRRPRNDLVKYEVVAAERDGPVLQFLNVVKSFGSFHVCEVFYHRTELGEPEDQREGRFYVDTDKMDRGRFAMQTIHAHKRGELTWQAYHGEVDIKTSHPTFGAAIFDKHFPGLDITGYTDYLADPGAFIDMLRQV